MSEARQSGAVRPAESVPYGRLVLGRSYRMWHIGPESVTGKALCGIDAGPKGIDSPIYSDVCKRCQRAYDREVRHG